MNKLDCVVVGAGVVGLAVARSMALAGREVVVLEKEAQVGTHATNDLGGGLDQVTVRRFGPGSGETQGFFRLRLDLK